MARDEDADTGTDKDRDSKGVCEVMQNTPITRTADSGERYAQG